MPVGVIEQRGDRGAPLSQRTAIQRPKNGRSD
jgi:hypothetical protein